MKRERVDDLSRYPERRNFVDDRLLDSGDIENAFLVRRRHQGIGVVGVSAKADMRRLTEVWTGEWRPAERFRAWELLCVGLLRYINFSAMNVLPLGQAAALDSILPALTAAPYTLLGWSGRSVQPETAPRGQQLSRWHGKDSTLRPRQTHSPDRPCRSGLADALGCPRAHHPRRRCCRTAAISGRRSAGGKYCRAGYSRRSPLDGRSGQHLPTHLAAAQSNNHSRSVLPCCWVHS